jgi:hypothetical protein
MATILKAGNVATGAQITSDATGILEIRTGTGAGTTAITVGTDQAVTIGGNNISAVNSLGFRNRIINGAMVIDQRNNGAASANTINGYFIDRWMVLQTAASGKIIAQQNAGSVTPPTGFTNYLGITSQSAYSITSSDNFSILQQIEGFNVADLGWGTANAQTVTLSFWVRSSLTGTFGGAFSNAGVTRSYPFSYTISAANTWELKSVTVAGDTSGTWATNNTCGIRVWFGLGAGSTYSGTAGAWAAADFRSVTGATSVVGTNGATFYITGVQLEAGSVATPFERRDYGRELAMAQRYAIRYCGVNAFDNVATGFAISTTRSEILVSFPVEMRTQPSVVASSMAVNDGVNNFAVTAAAISTTQTNTKTGFLQCDVSSGLTQFRPYKLVANNSTSASVLFSAEL